MAFELSAQVGKWLQMAFEPSAQVRKYKFCPQETDFREFCKAKLGKQGFALRRKCLQMAFEVSAQVGKYPQMAFEPSAQVGKYKFCPQETDFREFCKAKLGKQGFALQRKWLQMAFELSAQVGMCLQITFEPSAQVRKCLQMAFEPSAQVAALRATVQAEDENLQISAKSLTTDKIAEADRLRDQLYAGYKKAVAGYVNFPVESLAEAAKALNQHIKDYKIDVKAQLDKETGLLVNFIQDLEGKLAEQVKSLSLGAFVEKLKAANEDVRSLTSQRTDERAAKTAGALKAARAASDEAYRMLVLHVNAHALLEGEEAYAAFIDYANTEIAHFRQEVLGGAKKK